MNNLRLGVIGVGHLGYHHARLYAAMDGVELVGVADLDDARREKAVANFGVRAFADWRELLNAGVDAVSVATPTTTHAEIADACLRAGAHVLVEKPITDSLASARMLIETAARAGRLLQVGHVERFNGAVMALSGVISDPKFIECHRLSPYPGRGCDVSVAHDLMIHDLDIVLKLVNSDPVSVDAVGIPIFSDTEDIVNARIHFASGCVANLTASRVSMERMRKIRIFDVNAYVSTDYSAQQVLVYRRKPGDVPEGVNPMTWITVESLPVRQEEPLRMELESFVAAIRGETPVQVTGEDAYRALALAETIVEQCGSHR
ncbi:MAG TPA: Gfo/Idh/MocA family oxidoreductase [Candidatus Hydrogenedentes bacterium]|nr:Gfo/Idh/MocA family oxidoreductase [Candidatus Hydrogenedentota bacterium]HOJ69149.1 Gfo/Idh/MocA family oxidoreductase [Candidatus Hydrogenedentota bacterium]HOV59759.1 Gfo/Idh/MocA family oxidoreductase [Candidatus Hydrogenedentota bacterium]